MNDIFAAIDRLDHGIDQVAALGMACSDAPTHMRSPLHAVAELALGELREARDALQTIAQSRQSQAE